MSCSLASYIVAKWPRKSWTPASLPRAVFLRICLVRIIIYVFIYRNIFYARENPCLDFRELYKYSYNLSASYFMTPFFYILHTPTFYILNVQQVLLIYIFVEITNYIINIICACILQMCPRTYSKKFYKNSKTLDQGINVNRFFPLHFIFLRIHVQ